jgi:hypothetical protein
MARLIFDSVSPTIQLCPFRLDDVCGRWLISRSKMTVE